MSLSISDKIKVDISGHTALVTIDNPAANTWDTESLPALKDLVEKLNADKNIYALVRTGAHSRPLPVFEPLQIRGVCPGRRLLLVDLAVSAHHGQ